MRRLSPAASAYVAAFDAWLAAGADRRDRTWVAVLKRDALECLIADAGRDPVEFLRQVPRHTEGD